VEQCDKSRDQADVEATQTRDCLEHTFGNLALLTRPLNSSVSDSAFEIKKPEIAGNSALALDRYFHDKDAWDDTAIEPRGETLFDLATALWPCPKPWNRQGNPVSKSVGRNDLCPCGSGKKFKRCCGESKAQAAGKTAWDDAVIRAGKLSLELDAVKIEAAVARLRELLAVPGWANSQKLNGLETYATALQHHGEYQEALHQLEAIDPAWISTGDHSTRLAIALRKATSLSHLKRTDEALAVAPAAEQELPHVSPAMGAGTLLPLSQTYLLCEATDEAETACNQSIALAEGKPDLYEVHARALANLASIKLGSGVEQTEAEGVTLMERAIELKAQCGDLQGLANSYNNLGLYYGRIKRYERAIAFFRKDLQLSRIVGDFHGLAQTMLHLADLYSHLSQPSLAKKTLAEAEAVIEGLGNKSLKQSASVLSEAIAARREYAVQQGERIGPHTPCKCDGGKAYCDCCGQADFEPVSLPWELNATSEATAQASTIFDCFDGTLIRYFRDVSKFMVEEPRREPLPLPQVIENIWQSIDRQYHINVLEKRLRRIDKDMSAEARLQFTQGIPDGDMGRFAGRLTAALRDDFAGTMSLLRNPRFMDALVNYPRAKRTFWVAHEAPDEVSSARMDRFGKFDAPEDYLEAFSRCVRENAGRVDALNILLRRPQGWSPTALGELRRVLTQHDFDPAKLQRAHERASHKALADIISIVKHAAQAQQPVLTAQERVTRAMNKVMEAHPFTAEQKQWLSLIQEHLIQNLSIGVEDFDSQPLLTGRGGKARARQVFQGRLEPVIEMLNAAVAA
jgi:tetratricopeptide (TPR) repeat protein